MNVFVQLTITGLANGAILALAALGFVLIYKASGVINFAQGEFLLIGAYLVFATVGSIGLHWSVGVGVALLAAVVLGVIVERAVLRPLVGQPTIAVIMVTIGLASVLRAGVQLVWGTRPRAFPSFFPSGTLEVLGARLPFNRVLAIVLAMCAFAVFSLFFRYSRQGLGMRAVADDQQAALAVGISVRRTIAVAWVLAAVSAVIGGMLVANLIGVSGEVVSFGLVVFPVVILGGLDSIPGALVGGAIVGLLSTYSGGYIGGEFQTVIPYVLLVLILLIRPYGLFGQARIERV